MAVSVPNNKTEMPLSHYRGLLAEADPVALSQKSGIAYDEEKGLFSATVLGRPFTVSFPGGVVVAAEGEGEEATPQLSILLMRVILEAAAAPSTGSFIPYVKIPWGTTYLAAFNGRCGSRLAWSFPNAKAFSQACEALGGQPVESTADATFQFAFLPQVLVRLSFWEKDEEFPPQAQFLFSDNISLYFTAEDVAVVGDVLITALKKGVVR